MEPRESLFRRFTAPLLLPFSGSRDGPWRERRGLADLARQEPLGGRLLLGLGVQRDDARRGRNRRLRRVFADEDDVARRGCDRRAS